MKKVVPFILVFLIVFLWYGVAASATSISDLQNQTKTLDSNLKEAQEALKETKEEKITVAEELHALDATLSRLEDEIELINSKLEDAKTRIEKTEQELEQAQEDREKYYEVLKQRIKYMHENGKIGYFQVLLNSKSLMDLLNRMEYIRDIMEYDQTVVGRMKDNEVSIEQKKEQIELEKKEIELLVKQQTSKKHSLEQSKTEKASYLVKLNADEKKVLEQIKEWEEASKQIQKKIVELQQASKRKYSGGKLEWPVPNYYTISSPYGTRNSPISGRQEFHTGIDIPAPTGRNVLAGEVGTVLHAGNINGYGYTVIIDHGSGVSTLYAHNSKLLVKQGQEVKRGQVIALIGSTGYSTGPHSHFEVRVNGNHTNPMSYVK